MIDFICLFFKKINKFKRFIKPRYLATIFFESLGFVHRDRWYLNGDVSRLIFKDPDIDVTSRLGYSNALFNTRSGKILIGKNVIFGHECQVLTGRHADYYQDPLKFKPHIDNGFDIIIEDGVWLTSRVIVTGGVRIGSNSTILPGSVVTKNIPKNSIAGGMPATVLKNKKFLDKT